jgi:hypothetical protein
LARRDLETSSSSSSSDALSTGGALARVTAQSIAAAGPVIKQIEPLGNILDDHELSLKLAMCSQLAFLVGCTGDSPSSNIAATCPAARKKNTLQGSLPRVVARELLKGKGLENSAAFPMLPKAFKLQPLLNIINGYNMPIQALLDLLNVFTSVRAPGSGAFGFTITILGIGMLRLLVFLDFVVKLLASPGMCASSILELFELASELHGTVPPKARGIVSHVVFPDIEATLLSFS